MIIFGITVSEHSLVFHTSGGISSSPAAFLFLIFLSTGLISSCINSPSLITFGGFPSKFSKCCFRSYIRFSWLIAFSLAVAVLFFLFTWFTVCHAILDCLSSTEFQILLIWFCMYSVCSFRYMLANSFCAFLSFRAMILVELFLMHLEAVFTSARFVLLLLLGGDWRNSHIRHSECIFLTSSGVHRICFLVLTYIYL